MVTNSSHYREPTESSVAVTAVVLTHSLIRVCSFSPLFFCFLSHSLSFTITEFITHSGGGGWPVEEEAEEGEGKKQTLNTSRHSVCTLLRANGAHRGSSSSTSLLASLSAQLHHDHNRKEHNIPTSVGCSRLPTTDDRPTDQPANRRQQRTGQQRAIGDHACFACFACSWPLFSLQSGRQFVRGSGGGNSSSSSVCASAPLLYKLYKSTSTSALLT